jgi:Na+-transporting NADH:ubiquinone oxidoreductase subunit NqrE
MTTDAIKKFKKKKEPKPINFTKYSYDLSPGCYLTNYLITFLNFYYAIKYYQHYADLPEQTDYLLNKQMLCQFCILYNIFFGLSTLSCGLVHQFFYDEKRKCNMIFWGLGQGLRFWGQVIYFQTNAKKIPINKFSTPLSY